MVYLVAGTREFQLEVLPASWDWVWCGGGTAHNSSGSSAIQFGFCIVVNNQITARPVLILNKPIFLV